MKHPMANQIIVECVVDDWPGIEAAVTLNTGLSSSVTAEPLLSDRGRWCGSCQDEFLFTPFGLSSDIESTISSPAITFRLPKVSAFTRYHFCP